jgi:putative transposase
MAKPLTCLYCLYNSDNRDYLHEEHTVHLIVYHIIWCPKRRRRIVRGEIAQRLEHLVNEGADEQDWQVLNLSIQPDHVHLFIRSNPYTMPTDIARLIKGRSSHILREEFPHLQRMPSLRTRSTFYSTPGNVSSETIAKYIERQSKQ